MKTYLLNDTFNRRVLSRHKSILNALKAQRKHARAIRRANGSSAYVPYQITCSTGEPIDEQVWHVLVNNF